MSDADAQLRIRLPRDVKAWLERQSAKNMRTQSAEIVLALKALMAADPET